MDSLVTAALMNAAFATVLAGAVVVIARWIERPAVMHLLWVIVLVKLLSPPLVQLDVVPRPSALSIPQARTEVAVSLPPGGATLDAAVPRALGARRDPGRVAAWPSPRRLATLAVGLWLSGAMALALLTLVRGRRFARFVNESGRASRLLEDRVSELAERMGLSRSPSVRLVPGRVSPMLRPRWGGVEVLFPSGLLARLDPAERDALLAHELAHVRRRDHWIRYLELAALCAFWWLPVTWWARTRLRRAEEQCCDAWVVDTLPGSSRAYGRALVKTLEFLAGATRPVPALASGVGEVRHLEERLIMILKRSATPWLSRPSRVLLALSALVAVVVFPTWAELPASDDDSERKTEQREIESRYRDRVLELEREAAQLEAELGEVRARRMELEQEWRESHGRLELDRLRDEAERGRLERDFARQASELEKTVAATRARERRLKEEQIRSEIDHLRAAAVQRQADTARIQHEIQALIESLHERGEHDEAQAVRELMEQMLRSTDRDDDHLR